MCAKLGTNGWNTLQNPKNERSLVNFLGGFILLIATVVCVAVSRWRGRILWRRYSIVPVKKLYFFAFKATPAYCKSNLILLTCSVWFHGEPEKRRCSRDTPRQIAIYLITEWRWSGAERFLGRSSSKKAFLPSGTFHDRTGRLFHLDWSFRSLVASRYCWGPTWGSCTLSKGVSTWGHPRNKVWITFSDGNHLSIIHVKAQKASFFGPNTIDAAHVRTFLSRRNPN